MAERIFLELRRNGDVADWGRHAPDPYRGRGGASIYTGEHARIMRLVLRYSGPPALEQKPAEA